MARQRQKNWGAWVIAIGTALAIGWLIAREYRIGIPSAETAPNQPQIVQAPVIPEVGIRSGTSGRAPVGGFTIKVERIAGQSISIAVSSESKDTYRFKKAQVGQRLVIPAHDGTYYLDIARVDGSTVYFNMSK